MCNYNMVDCLEYILNSEITKILQHGPKNRLVNFQLTSKMQCCRLLIFYFSTVLCFKSKGAYLLQLFNNQDMLASWLQITDKPYTCGICTVFPRYWIDYYQISLSVRSHAVIEKCSYRIITIYETKIGRYQNITLRIERSLPSLSVTFSDLLIFTHFQKLERISIND